MKLYVKDEYGIEVATEGEFQKVVSEKVDEILYDYEDASDMVYQLIREHQFALYDLLNARDEELEEARQMVRKNFERQTRKRLLEEEWTEVEVTLSEEEVAEEVEKALRSMPAEKISQLFTSVTERK